MLIVSLIKKSLVFPVLLIILFLPDISAAFDIKEVTSSQLKDTIQGKSDRVLAVIFLTPENHFFQEHLPDLNDIYKKHNKKNVELLGVLLRDPEGEAKSFIGEKGVSFPFVKARDEEEMRYIFAIGIIPVVYYYKDGRLAYKEEGYREPDHLEKDLLKCMEGVSPHEKGVD